MYVHLKRVLSPPFNQRGKGALFTAEKSSMHIEQAEAVKRGSWEMQRVLMQTFLWGCDVFERSFFDWTVKTGCNDFSHSSMPDSNIRAGRG